MAVILDTRVVSGAGGGPDKTILNSPRYLAPAGYRNVCAYMHPPDDPGFEQLRRKAELCEAPLESVPDRGPWDWRVVTQLLQICRRERVRIWHGHDYKSNALGLLLCRFWPMRLVTTVHGWVKQTSRTPLYYAVDRQCLKHYDRVACVSHDLLQKCLASAVPAERCMLIENAIDTEQYRRRLSVADAKRQLGRTIQGTHKPEAQARDHAEIPSLACRASVTAAASGRREPADQGADAPRSPLPSERLIIGAVGRLSAEKGFDLLIRATDELVRRGLDVHLVIVGEGDQRPELEKLIAALRRQDHIRVLGYESDARPIYEAMDVFALSSHREGLPNVLLEAMAMEVPVVATRIAGIPRLVRHGENGLLVEPGAAASLTNTLERLLLDADLRSRLAQAGRRTIERDYSFAVRMQKMRAIYEELLRQGAESWRQNHAHADDSAQLDSPAEGNLRSTRP